jgi:thiol-disulfide isomerase/thioredoxin
MEVESWQKRILGFAMDWGIALSLTAIGFWLFSSFRTPNLPDRAPEWNLPAISGGEIALSDYQGKTVVLNFWATWCQPCIMEIPTFEKFSNENPNIPVIGIAVDGTIEQLSFFAKEHKMTYPIVIANPKVQEDYKISTLPMTVIVGPDGTVKDAHVGIMLEQQLKWLTN